MHLSYQENEFITADLYLQTKKTIKVSPLKPTIINITGLHEPERVRVEGFIKAIYKESYNARISVDYPVLMSVRNKDNQILAATGIRYADKEALFLEQYTDNPIDNILGCERDCVVEIGNLASAGQGASIFLFAALASYLDSKNIQYASITGTDFLHRYFQRIGLDPQKICDAKYANVKTKEQDWGSYYQTQPRVLVGSVQKSVKRLKKVFGSEFEARPPEYYTRLHYKG